MDFITAVKTCFSKYATFSGRAPRSEYWFFQLFFFIVSICLQLLDGAVFGMETMERDSGGGIFSLIFFVVSFLPNLAVTARRFHDIGHTGWWQLGFPLMLLGVGIFGGGLTQIYESLGYLILIGGIGGIGVWWIVWMVTASHAGENRFGPNPLETPANEAE